MSRFPVLVKRLRAKFSNKTAPGDTECFPLGTLPGSLKGEHNKEWRRQPSPAAALRLALPPLDLETVLLCRVSVKQCASDPTFPELTDQRRILPSMWPDAMQSSFGWQATQVNLLLAFFLFLVDGKVKLGKSKTSFPWLRIKHFVW